MTREQLEKTLIYYDIDYMFDELSPAFLVGYITLNIYFQNKKLVPYDMFKFIYDHLNDYITNSSSKRYDRGRI